MAPPPRHAWPGATALIGAGVVVVFAAPLVWAFASAFTEMIARGAWDALAPDISAIFGSLTASGVIALAATALGVPGARVLARSGRVWVGAVVALPALLPPYLAYSGWGVLRDPTWWTGRAIGNLGLQGSAPEALALIGLALWSCPIASAVLAPSFRANAVAEEAMRLEPAPWWRRAVFTITLHRRAFVTAASLVGVVMLGSAIPLHLAQFETLATHAWLALDRSTADERFRAWVGVWPLVLAAVLAGWWFGAARRRRYASPPGPVPSPRRRSWVGFALVWGAAVVVPAVLFALVLRRPDAVRSFLERAGDAIVTSSLVAAATALGVCLLTVWAAASAGSWRRRDRLLGAWTGRLAVAVALVPGVLVGQAAVVALNREVFDPITGSLWVLVLVHLARFGFVGLWGGRAITMREPGELAWLRMIDGADSLVGWLRAALPAHGGWVAVLALVAACLSLHEIEAAVMVSPPGVDLLSRRVLDDLHFERPDRRSAAALIALAIGAVVAAAACGISVWARRGEPGRPGHR